MKKTVLLVAAVVLAVFAATFGAGCLSNADEGNPIVGEWKTVQGNIPVIIHANGTGSFTLTIFGFSKEYPLTWEPTEDYANTYTVTTTEPEIPLGIVTIPMGDYIISDDGKTLKGPTTLNNPLTLKKTA